MPESQSHIVTPTPEGSALARKLGLFDITMLVMGSVIGVGIFVVPHTVAGLVPSSGLVLGTWVIGGLIMLAGALVYAELARRRPHVGGQYAFLREAYHPGVAFVYGWSLLWIIQSGGIAAVAVIFGQSCDVCLQAVAREFSPGDFSVLLAGIPDTALAVLAIVSLTIINCLGVRAGSNTQNVFMVLKILAIAALVVSGLWFVTRSPPTDGEISRSIPQGTALLTAFCAALVPVFFAYGGAHTTTFIAGEVRDPCRNLPRGLVLGMLGVVVLYLAVNVACMQSLGVDRLAMTEKPCTEVMERAWGRAGSLMMTAAIALSALGFLSQATLTSPRVYYAMAHDRVFFKEVAWVHPTTRAPVAAILLQGIFATAIALQGTFLEILNYVMSVEMSFFALTAIALFIIRRRDAGRPDAAALRMPGHPVTTLAFTVVNLILVCVMVCKDPLYSLRAVGIALAGVPVYVYWRWRQRSVLAANHQRPVV